MSWQKELMLGRKREESVTPQLCGPGKGTRSFNAWAEFREVRRVIGSNYPEMLVGLAAPGH